VPRVDFGIGPSQRLLLTAALSSDRAAALSALETWWGKFVDFDQVRGTDSTLFPQIYWNIGTDIRDARLAARLKGTARHRWIRNQYLMTTCAQLLELLRSAEIPALLLKGAAIATRVDVDPGLRSIGDCDVLVPRARAIEAATILASSKLTEREALGERDLDIVHGLTILGRETRAPLLDLHWQPLRDVGSVGLADEMFARSVGVDFFGQACLAPSFEHMLLHAIVHGTDWSPDPRYDWLVDSIKILRRAGDGFDWERITDLARRYHYDSLVGMALAEVDKAGQPVPPSVLKRLSARFAPWQRRELKVRRSRPSSRSAADELLLSVQRIRRSSAEALGRPALGAVPTVLKSLFGAPSGSRSFIANDRSERVTLLHGWSAPEPTGRWTEGRFVSLAIHAPGNTRPAALKLRAYPLRSETTGRQRVNAFVGLRRLGRFAWSKAGPDPYAQTVYLPRRAWRGDTIVVRFHVKNLVSPVDIHLSGDPRALGIFVEEISVDPPLCDLANVPLDLSSHGAAHDALWHGWLAPGPNGCRTLGKFALLRWRNNEPPAAGSALMIEIGSPAPGQNELAGRFLINGRRIDRILYSSAADSGALVGLPIPPGIPAGEEMELCADLRFRGSRVFAVRKAERPRLALTIRRVWIDSTAAGSGKIPPASAAARG
jgi:hypothetical protein